MIGVSRCGIPAYADSSTRFGSSTMIMRTWSGVALMITDVGMELMKLDLPEPVAPATKRCGILVRSAVTKWPSTSLPTPVSIGFGSFLALSGSEARRQAPRFHGRRSVFRCRWRTCLRSPTGCARRSWPPRRPCFSRRSVTFSTFTPGPSSTSYMVTDGPSQKADDFGIDIELLEGDRKRANHTIVLRRVHGVRRTLLQHAEVR